MASPGHGQPTATGVAVLPDCQWSVAGDAPARPYRHQIAPQTPSVRVLACRPRPVEQTWRIPLSQSFGGGAGYAARAGAIRAKGDARGYAPTPPAPPAPAPAPPAAPKAPAPPPAPGPRGPGNPSAPTRREP